MARIHWAKIKVKKMKRQNKSMKHKSKHRVFLFIKIKIKYLNNFIKTFGTVLIKTIFNIRKGNTSREFIGTCKYSVLNIEWRIAA